MNMQISPENRTKNSITVENLVVDFALDNALFKRQYMRAVNDVSFDLRTGEALAVVGESGSGKSTCARALCRLYEPTSGRILMDGEDVHCQNKQISQRDYAKEVQMIFQDPFGSLNPVHTIRHHLARPMKLHYPNLNHNEVEERVIEIIKRVGLSPAKQTADKYPHELSGGQRQRVAIARALAVGARFILADEPISMLDVSIRLGILNLMADMKQDDIGFLYITHDIATARYFAERTAVMYVGHMVEWGNSDSVTQNPQHPYTKLLISAVPEPGMRKQRTVNAKKADIPLWKPESKGCPFAERCLQASDKCREIMPQVTQLAEDHYARCHLFQD